jgi:ketosteroid isomerase-like protein
MTTVQVGQEMNAIRAVAADAETQSDADGFAQLLTEDVALLKFGGRRVLGPANVHDAMPPALETPFAHVYNVLKRRHDDGRSYYLLH